MWQLPKKLDIIIGIWKLQKSSVGLSITNQCDQMLE